MRKILALAILVGGLSSAQEAVKVPFACAPEVLEAAGLLCTEQEPCAIFLELTAVAPLGNKLFLAGNLHANSGTLESILLMSDDGGLNWKEPAKRVPSAALDQLQFYDLEHGWAAGEVQYPLPVDPFFLVTTDGGQTWRKRPVSDDGGPGSVLRFAFDSAKHGELVIDAGKSAEGGRYVRWESETGGESWMVRSATSDLPSQKRGTAAEVPDFRIRAVGEKSYAIEKRTGESKWETMASFAIEAASCQLKPKEPAPDTPPPPVKEPGRL